MPSQTDTITAGQSEHQVYNCQILLDGLNKLQEIKIDYRK